MEPDFEKALGKRIAALRSLRFSQQGLADELGVSRNAVMAWEKGTSVPDTVNLVRLADLFDISLDEMVGRAPMPERIEEDAILRMRALLKTLTGQQKALDAQQNAFRQLLEVLLSRKVLPEPDRDKLLKTLGRDRG